ncbi:MAG TPA: DUF4337 domain-containing protein [Chloroflexota bacterium]|nr:DUF4337 domain-containing protein [Chloroflexota bacterium]
MAHEIELETHEIREKFEQLREEHERDGSASRWIQMVALTTGVMAVLAAVGAQESATLSSEALLLSNRSVLAQAKASDAWNEYQADSVKSKVYDTQTLVAAGNPSQAAAFSGQAQSEAAKQPGLQSEAQNLEAERDRLLTESGQKNAIHETFARSLGALQIGIALAAIGAVTRRRESWYLGCVFGLAGAGLLGWGFAGGTF